MNTRSCAQARRIMMNKWEIDIKILNKDLTQEKRVQTPQLLNLLPPTPKYHLKHRLALHNHSKCPLSIIWMYTSQLSSSTIALRMKGLLKNKKYKSKCKRNTKVAPNNRFQTPLSRTTPLVDRHKAWWHIMKEAIVNMRAAWAALPNNNNWRPQRLSQRSQALQIRRNMWNSNPKDKSKEETWTLSNNFWLNRVANSNRLQWQQVLASLLPPPANKVILCLLTSKSQTSSSPRRDREVSIRGSQAALSPILLHRLTIMWEAVSLLK